MPTEQQEKRVLKLLTIKLHDLDEEVARHTSGVYMVISRKYAKAKANYEDIEITLKEVVAQKNLHYRRSLPRMKEEDPEMKDFRITDDSIKALVESDEEVVALKREKVAAEEDLVFWTCAEKAAWQRSYMLTALSDLSHHEQVQATSTYNKEMREQLKN